MAFNERCTIQTHEDAAPGYRMLVLAAPQIAAAATPGQFVHIRLEVLAHTEPQALAHRTEDRQVRLLLPLHAVGLFVKLWNRRPVPLLLRTGPEGAAEGLRPSRLRQHLLFLILQRHDFPAMGNVDSHRHVTIPHIEHRGVVTLPCRCRQEQACRQQGHNSSFHAYSSHPLAI